MPRARAGSRLLRERQRQRDRVSELVTGYYPACSYLVVVSCLPHRHMGHFLQCASADLPWLLPHRQWVCIKDYSNFILCSRLGDSIVFFFFLCDKGQRLHVAVGNNSGCHMAPGVCD